MTGYNSTATGTVFSEPLNLCIDWHVDSPIPSDDPYAHTPKPGACASVLRLLRDRELALVQYEFDACIQVHNIGELWDAINANCVWILWNVPAMFNADAERIVASNILTEEVYIEDIGRRLEYRRAA